MKHIEKRRADRGIRGKDRDRPDNNAEFPRGYTLVELLVVLAILALLVGIATPMVLKYLGSSKIDTARIQVENIASSLDLYRLDMQHYPTAQDGLKALIVAPPDEPDWNGPYIKKAKALNDPWGHAYHYRIPGEHGDFDLWSSGPSDNDDGNNPAIANW